MIGDFVTVGHGAILHGCTIGENTVIGMGAIILNHAQIGKNCIIEKFLKKKLHKIIKML